MVSLTLSRASAALLLAIALCWSQARAEPDRLEAEEFASPKLVRTDETASGGAYVTRVNAKGEPVGRMVKFPVSAGLGEMRLWARGRRFNGVIELRSMEAESENRQSGTMARETRRESPRLKMEFGGDSDDWIWVDLGVHDLSGVAVIVPWAHEDPEAGPQSGLDCIILSADPQFDPTAGD